MERDILSSRKKIAALTVPKVTGWDFSSEKQRKLIEDIQFYNEKLLPTYEKFQQEGESGAEMSQEFLHSLLGCLDAIEHCLYLWFQMQQPPSVLVPSQQLPSVPAPPQEQKLMFEVLTQLQVAHREGIKKIVELDLAPWITEQEPKALEDAGQLWSCITQRGSDGAFRIANEVDYHMMTIRMPRMARRDLQDDLFASLARLISRPRGRRLLQIIHTQGLQGKGVTFTLNPTGLELGSLSPIAAPTGKGAQCQWAERKATMVPNTGSGGQVACVVGLSDSDMTDFDIANTLLPSPVFIGLGHELVHIAHYQNGTYMGNTAHFPEVASVYSKLVAQVYSKQSLMATPAYQGSGSLEEFLTIPTTSEQVSIANQLQQMGVSFKFEERPFTPQVLIGLIQLNGDIPTENSIRDEHQLGARHTHRSIANPLLYPSAQEDALGEVVTGPKEWAKRVKLI